MNESGLPTDFLTVLALEVVERSSALDVSMVPLWSRGCFSHVSSPAGWHGPHGVRISSEMSPKLHPNHYPIQVNVKFWQLTHTMIPKQFPLSIFPLSLHHFKFGFFQST
jgi:hypothetical protein